MKVGFIGAGTVGTALAVRLFQRDYPVVAVSSRSLTSANRLAQRVLGCQVYPDLQEAADAAELVFITTPDDEIARTAARLRWRPDHRVVHCSGAASLDILQSAKDAGAQVGGFHPLQTFASIDQAIENLPGSTFGIEASGELLERLREMAQALDGDWVELKGEDKVLYHAAAVFACNYWVTLVQVAADLWGSFGADPPKAVKALTPLLRGTLANLEKVGLPNALTGPIARGDLGTIGKHLAALEKKASQFIPLYRELGSFTVPVAVAKGRVNEGRAEEMRKLLRG